MQDVKAINLQVQFGVAVREFPTATGPADYMLFADDKEIDEDLDERTGYEESIARDYRATSDMTTRAQANLDILWLKDDSLEDSENLPPPAELAEEIIASLETALEEFRGVEDALNPPEDET